MRRRHNGVAIPPAGPPRRISSPSVTNSPSWNGQVPARLPFTCSDRALWAFLLRHRMVLVKPVTVVA